MLCQFRRRDDAARLRPRQPLSSSGLGHRPFKAAARVRIPLGAPCRREQHHLPLPASHLLLCHSRSVPHWCSRCRCGGTAAGLGAWASSSSRPASSGQNSPGAASANAVEDAAATGLAAGILVAVPRVSPLAAGLLSNGVLGGAGLAMIVPLFQPSRGRRAGVAAESEMSEARDFMADLRDSPEPEDRARPTPPAVSGSRTAGGVRPEPSPAPSSCPGRRRRAQPF